MIWLLWEDCRISLFRLALCDAALFWADARQRGIPTASPDALDSDVILAACAATIGHPGDQILVATQNVGHLARYCDARLWTTIA